MKVKLIKPLGPKLERSHIDNDSPYKAYTGIYKRQRENEIRHKQKKKLGNRRKNKGK